MQSMVLSRESISSICAVVIPVRPLFATSSFRQSTGIHILTPSSVYISEPRLRRELYSTPQKPDKNSSFSPEFAIFDRGKVNLGGGGGVILRQNG